MSIRESTADAAPITKKRGRWVLPLLLLAAVLGGVFFVPPIRSAFRPAPKLAPALRLVNEGKTAEAEAKLTEYLAYDPGNLEARLALADLLLSRTEPKPEEALATLAPIRRVPPRRAAEVLFLRGKANEQLFRPGRAEREWEQALKLDPLIGEAGWLLLQLYYAQGRAEDSRRLAIRLSQAEPNPADRVRLLLEPIRHDAEPLAAAGVLARYKEAVAREPEDPHTAVAYARAQAREGTGVDGALRLLRGLIERQPEDLALRDALMFALDRTGDLEGLAGALAALPAKLAQSPKFARYRGRLAIERRDDPAAIRELEAAIAADPSDRESLHRLGEAYKRAAKAADSERIRAKEADMEAALVELRGARGKAQGEGPPGLFEDVLGRPNFGREPDPALYRRFADLRERLGHPDEALAWHRLVLRDAPDDVESREAVARLEKIVGGEAGTSPERRTPGPSSS